MTTRINDRCQVVSCCNSNIAQSSGDTLVDLLVSRSTNQAHQRISAQYQCELHICSIATVENVHSTTLEPQELPERADSFIAVCIMVMAPKWRPVC